LVSYFDIGFTFILISNENWLLFDMMALCIVSVYWLSDMKQEINQSKNRKPLGYIVLQAISCM